ncbi:MAG: beta-barrel fold lipoprotein [Tannerellaceae bacterium]|jgi:hypothetical protein|nr:beta-barrel fold lipoprotein [Tannerellaceae bacterium]
MKTKVLLALLLLISTLINFSCVSSSGGGDDLILNSKEGVHKIQITFTGDGDVSFIASFTGVSGKTQAKLYDLNGDYQGTTYIARGDAKNTTKVICETNKDATILSSTLNVTCIKAGKKVTYTMTAYIDGKQVDEITKTVNFTNSVQTDAATISTSNSI